MKLTAWMRSHTHQFVFFLLLVQPVMDVLSFWMQKLGLPNAPTLLLRFGVLGLTMVWGFVLSDRKKLYYLAAGICAALGAGHIFACWQAGFVSPVSDLTNYIRVLQMPVTAICLMTFLRQNPDSFKAMQKGLLAVLLVTLAVELVSVLTGTDPHTYDDGSGVLGWFNNTNSQSSNLCVLVPIALGWILTLPKHRKLLFAICALGGFTAMYFFSTRLAYLGIAAVGVGLAFSIVLVQRKNWKYAVVLMILTAAFAGLLPVSPMMEHMRANNYIQDQRQGFLDRQLSSSASAPEEDENSANFLLEDEMNQNTVYSLTPIYRFYVKDFVEMFGPERTMDIYDYSVEVRDFASLREKKLQYAALLMRNSPKSAEVFGLELGRFTVGSNIYDVENDFHGIYYLFGAVGLAAMLAFIGYFVGLVIWALVKNAKRYYTLEAASYGIALIMCLIHAYCTAGVLRRPNASVYLAAILAGIYYLVRVHRYPEEG